jgi:NAD(P)H-hydrate epimerase
VREAEALEALGVSIADQLNLDNCRTVLDAIFGTGLNRAPEGRAAEWIEAINDSGRRVVAVDVPSGLDSDSGRAFAPALRASLTVTLGLPKAGLLEADGPGLAGEVWVADIGIPFEAYREIGLEVPAHLFAMHDRVQLAGLRL